ncbi:MAG: mannitol dehydrogenase family protein [Planctomycetaceae bacterium]|nr:mannitol dehydrogenase family protein [Planctomycetaceae bacterium]
MNEHLEGAGALPRLSNATVNQFGAAVAVPAYDRSALKTGIVHMSVGGFHRAHQAVYLDDLFARGSGHDWGVCGVGLLDADNRMRDALVPQDCLYTVVERSEQADRARVIGSMTEYLYAPENPQRVLDRLAAPEIRMITLTITEGGYFVDQVTGGFDDQHPNIRHDLRHPATPTTGIGYLTEGLNLRRQRGAVACTVLSCDNLPGNGDVARKMVLAFAALREPELAEWISRNIVFPNSMVDRITPVTTDADRALVAECYGYEDRWPVVCEPFRQWIVEDKFCAGRPPWEQVGVQMTSDVQPYEKMKIRLLNSSHSAMAYLGYLAGFRFIHEVAADPEFQRFITDLMEKEVVHLLDPVPGVDLVEYQQILIKRFANPKIKDQVARVASEGSQKIPKFMLPSIRQQLAQGGSVRLHALALAGWFRYLAGTDEQGAPITINDPIATELQTRAQAGGKDPARLLALGDLFGTDLSENQYFVTELCRAMESLYEHGTRATLRDYLQS